MGSLWEQADLSERHGILKTMLDTVYIDVVSTKAVVGVVPKPAFYPLFAALHQRPEAGVYVASPERIGRIVIAPDDDGRDDFWVWWRRGRVEVTPSILAMGLYPVFAA